MTESNLGTIVYRSTVIDVRLYSKHALMNACMEYKYYTQLET